MLIIGRDGQTSQLNVSVGQKTYRFFASDSVPTDVSRQHCLVTLHGNGKYTIRNIKATNVTFVNGLEIEEKTVTDNDRVEIGRSHYLLNLSYIVNKVIPQLQPQKEFDITPLKKIWDDYNNTDIKFQKHQKNLSLLTSIPMCFTMLGGLISGLSADLRRFAIVFTVIAFVIMIYGLIKRITDKTLEKRQQLKFDFQQKYICPNSECSHFLGSTQYISLIKKGQCPFCGVKYFDSKKQLS